MRSRIYGMQECIDYVEECDNTLRHSMLRIIKLIDTQSASIARLQERVKELENNA